MDHPAAPAWPDSNHDLTLQYKVYLGVWTDWSRGRVLGATLTLDRQRANLLIAFTASFVVIVGSRFWRIVCLALHQIYSTSDLSDALHHQRQVVLRNSGSSDSGVFKLVTLLHAWRGSSFKSIMRIIPALLLATLCTIGFTIAGGYSSQIQLGSDNIGSAVLLDGTNCGVISNITTMGGDIAYEKLLASFISTASNYVQECYSENSTGLADCNYFVSQRLPGFVDNAAPCPFNSSICRNNSSNLALDTGLLNTDVHFGLNAPPNERLFIRHRLECAPLLTDGHASVHGNYTRYDYGPQQVVIDPGSQHSTGFLNYTYEVESLANQYAVMDDNTLAQKSYILRPVTSNTINGTPGAGTASGLLPNEQLERTDADIFLVFLSGHGVFFSEPLHDAWYRATKPFATMANRVDEDSLTIYRSSEAASPLGCASQWQFCNTDTSRACGPLASFYDAVSGAIEAFRVGKGGSVKNGSLAIHRLDWILASMSTQYTSEPAILRHQQDSALLSKQSLFEGYQAPIPENQWQLDVTNWFAIYLAMMQSNLLQAASGSMEAGSRISATRPFTDAARSLCSNQKIRTTRYSSFSFFGLLFTYTLGSLILITSYSVESILGWLHRRRKYKQYAYLEWTTNETLQLHRVANEGPSELDGTWSHCTSWVPTTDPGVILSGLDISDLKHPRIPSKDQDNITSSMVATEDDPDPPETVGSGDSSLEPNCNTAQRPETPQTAVNADSASLQTSGCAPEMTAVALVPNSEGQVVQSPISSQAVEPPSPLEETPCQIVPGNTSRERPEQMSGFNHGRMLSPHSFPPGITETERASMRNGGSAMDDFI